MPAATCLLILAGCAHQTPTAARKLPVWGASTWSPLSGCEAFPRLTFDRLADTLPTIAGVKAYNAKRDAVCGVGK